MRDPKSWAKVPVPLKRSIISAMGGQQSEDYKHFRKLAVEAYIILRKHSSLFLTLLACMMGSAIDCFSGDSAAISLDFALSQVLIFASEYWDDFACARYQTTLPSAGFPFIFVFLTFLFFWNGEASLCLSTNLASMICTT
jgi:hypothetical protein